jgi:quercetin dioxygenase-like cupin family protein
MERVSLSASETVEAVEGVYLTQLAATDSMSVQHFHIEPGATVPEHSHPHEQSGWVYEGSLVFLVDGEEVLVSDGDSYGIPGGEPHAAENRADVAVKGVDIFSPPRLNPDWKE